MAKGEGAGKGSRAGGQENGVPHLDGARKELLQELARREGTPLFVIDHEKIREAFVNTNYTSGKALIMPYKKIQFNEKGENPNADETFLQAYKGKYYIVYPFEIADPDYKTVWPRPGWK